MNANRKDGSLLDEIEGARKDGQFAVTHWPKPRVSNPTFLSDLVAEMAAEDNARAEKRDSGN
ncbi:MAG: hypothetical protein E5Y67_12515 [Mesorhizobium sp.]|uniref:hypothetical protein n=1 Tax=Mesorhizobium sp. TaxID=1871066 RepID=UPI001206E15F|nr:hypothetical protein [Mesorhizobium sp.]TIM14495.1 MAG: hypothetical protein E5Y67_12515 [Mesorhizobium sp.]